MPVTKLCALGGAAIVSWLVAAAQAVPLAVDTPAGTSTPVPRNVRISGTKFVLANTLEEIVMAGPNVVVKGPPYLPLVSGNTSCNDVVNPGCEAEGTCSSCTTFNEADVSNLKAHGFNTIRLGVVWAGAQPRDENQLDPEFVSRLDAVLTLCDKHGIHVILDNHGDMTGTANCGNGAPIWFQQKAAGELIGKPLTTDFPYDLVVDIRETRGYKVCGDNATLWALHAGDANFNLLNPCCLAMNSPNPVTLGYTSLSQATMDFMIDAGPGRDDFVRYWKLMAEAVVDHPSAFAAELANEPMTLKRRELYQTWQAAAEAINSVIPDMSVALSDTGENSFEPAWVDKFIGPSTFIDPDVIEWMKNSSTLFYAWHWYGFPFSAKQATRNMQERGEDWQMPTFATEFADCRAWRAAAEANISHTYWHYSAYCTTGPAFGNRAVPDDTFGGCLLGWVRSWHASSVQ